MSEVGATGCQLREPLEDGAPFTSSLPFSHPSCLRLRLRLCLAPSPGEAWSPQALGPPGQRPWGRWKEERRARSSGPQLQGLLLDPEALPPPQPVPSEGSRQAEQGLHASQSTEGREAGPAGHSALSWESLASCQSSPACQWLQGMLSPGGHEEGGQMEATVRRDQGIKENKREKESLTRGPLPRASWALGTQLQIELPLPGQWGGH